MTGKDTVMLLALFCVMLEVNQGAADPAITEINTMIILDATGSMNVEHCVDEQGSSQDRFWCAKEDAKAGIYVRSETRRYYALYLLAGSDSGIVDLDADNPQGRYFTNDRDEIIAAIDSVQPTIFYTALADVVCDAMSYLQDKADDDSDDSYLNIYTDGGENVSVSEVCGDYDINHVNTFDFTLDATESYGGGTVVDNNDRYWVSDGSRITQEGRAYQLSIYDPEYDWAGGVLPGSWEWRIYYRTAWGDSREIGDEENFEWSPPVSEGDVIMSINAFVDEVFPGDTSTAASLLSASVQEGDIEVPAYYSTTSTTSSTPAFSSLPPTEDTLFSGLAELTHGRYVKIEKGSRSPILGDINLDGEVNETDLRAVYTWFGRPVDRYNQGSIDADITLGGFVDNADMMYIRYNWTDESKAAPIMGDIDYNWCVDETDLNQVMQWYGHPVNPGAQHSYHADINADGFIDDADVDIVEANMYQGCQNHQSTCNDGRKNYAETDVDCGGLLCTGCKTGKKCAKNSDCISNKCEASVCMDGSPGNINAVVDVYTDWSAGYCANLSITNNAGSSTKSWTVVMSINGGTIYTSWNGNFSGTSGSVTVTNLSWNNGIGSGQTINSPGFCVNRNGGGTATVVSAAAVY